LICYLVNRQREGKGLTGWVDKLLERVEDFKSDLFFKEKNLSNLVFAGVTTNKEFHSG